MARVLVVDARTAPSNAIRGARRCSCSCIRSARARAPVSETTCQLAEGDLLILYTDGVTEATNAAGAQFGIEQLTAAVEKMGRAPVQQVCDELLGLASSWSSGQQEDDLTVLVLRHVGLARRAAA